MPEPTFAIETWIVIVGLAAVGAIVRVSMWVGSVNSGRTGIKDVVERIEKKLDDLIRRSDDIGNDIACIKEQIKPAATSWQFPVSGRAEQLENG